MSDDIEVKKYVESTLRKTKEKNNNNNMKGYGTENSSSNSYNTSDNSKTKKSRCTKKKIWIVLGIVLTILIGGIVTVCIIFIKNDNDDKPKIPDDPSDPFSVIIPVYDKGNKKLESEFEFKTKVGDLKRIYVHQKYLEDRLYEGQKILKFKDRKTNYDIFIMSESEPKPDFINYYNKLYTAAISIVSECFGTDNEDCVPETLVDLTGSNIHNTRNLVETNDLKGIPVPICLFNFTNNDVITSITCPDSFPEDKKKLMVLDLYFFRPPGLKRPNKEEVNVTITKSLKGDNLFIRETNGGICDLENSIGSFCTTDMNTTTDKEGNILTYEEEANMFIEIDELNTYSKNKITKLEDKTKEIESLNPEVYKSTLNQLLPLLEPYFKYDELFTKEDFEEILLVSKEGPQILKKLKSKRRLQSNDNPKAYIENTLLDFDGNSGIKVEIDLVNNPGIGNEFMEANSKLKIENKNKELSSSKQSSFSIKKIINELTYLSQAGNNLVTRLYQNTNISLENMTEDINNDISYLNSLVKYKDISDIFDATLSLDAINKLPFSIIQETTNLKTKLEQILNGIENGGIKNNIKILNDNIYKYTNESHYIINQLFDNLSELTKSLSSSKSILTEISTYYLNNTCNSYLSTIEEAEKILMNYYKDEFNLIKPKVDQVLNIFEDSIIKSLQKQLSIINSLYEKIENKNYTIELANEENLRTIINNLYYLKNYLNELINKIKTKVNKELDVKENGYLMTPYDINSNYERSIDVITNGRTIAKNLDNDEYIDTTFDRIMSQFRANYTNIQKFMDKEKEEKFPLNENVLKEEHFSSEVRNNMQNDINEKGVDILNSIRKENEEYLKEKNKVIKDFIENDQNYLNTLTFEIDSLYTEKKLGELAQLYETAFKSCLTKTTNEMNNNYNWATLYFNDLSSLMQDDKKIIEVLRKYKSDRTTLLKHNPWKSLRKYEFEDTISGKYKTEGYLNKYRTFIQSFARSREFINNQIYQEFLSEYKSTMFKLRELLQNFKNNKMTNKYPDTSEFSFIDNHIISIDNLYNRLNNKISDSIFNSQYINLYDQFRKTSNNYLNNVDNFIVQKHSIINPKETKSDIIYDFCVTFKRKISYTCVNGVVATHIDSDSYCFPVTNSYQNNLVTHSINTDNNYLAFKTKFNEFYSSINDRVNKYTSKISNLKSALLNAETIAINKGYTLDYLNPIINNINTLLSQKYGDKLVQKSYDYFQTNIQNIMKPLLDSISNKWEESFDIVIKEINDNLDNFKHSMGELSYLAAIYSVNINNNITNNYFNSIEVHQKNEFNYTINYYYNILLKMVKSTHQYIINKIPNNRVGYNNILDKRKKEVNNVFNNLINIIEKSEENALNFTQQCYILQVPKTNFFKINEVLSTNKLETDKSLEAKVTNLYTIRTPKSNNEYSLTAKFYLENQQSKLQIDELYDQINRKVFIFLNLDKFKDILIDNWIFDQDEFINGLNNTLYNSNLQIEKEFSNEKDKYRKQLEKYITTEEHLNGYFTKESLINIISELYKNEIKNLENNQVNTIKQNVQEILNKIKQYIVDEANRIQIISTSYNKDFTIINNRINSYKAEIFKKLNNTIFGILETFYQNLNNNLYKQYVLEHLDQCVSFSKKYTERYSDFSLLNSTYKIGEIIDTIIYNIVVDIKSISKNQIDYIYEEKYNEIKNIVGIDSLQKLINDQINQEYNSKLVPALQKVATTEPGVTGYTEYDFNNTILVNINSLIETNMNKIRTIMDTTKGSNYDINVNTWEKDCSKIDVKVENIKSQFEEFMYIQKVNEEEDVDEFLKTIIKNNFNNLLNNIIPSFGNDFFERIIKYNENFKISSLYDSLTYSLSQTLSYYLLLHSPDVFSALTKDLKLKLFSLNNLDVTVQEKNDEVLKLLEEEVNNFIVNSKEFLINKYKSFLTTDLSIELSFNETINDKIKTNFNLVQLEIETDYLNLLNKYFKKQLIESYSKVMNAKTAQMINTIKDERESLKSKIDDYFTIEPDGVLNDINLKLNNTLNSIERFKRHFNTFKISDDLPRFLNNYGDKLKPNFENFINLVNEATKDKINLTVEANAVDYINHFNQEEFNKQTNHIYSNIKEQYIDNINIAINNYGIDDYPNNLETEINSVGEKSRRRSLRGLTEDEITNLIKERVADKAIDDTFSKLLTSSNNAKIFINAFKKFDEFNTEIEKNINNLNSAYKSSLNLIKKNNYEEEMHNFLIQKLSELKNFTLDYYNNITESFNRVRDYLNDSINEIDMDLNNCANITYRTFEEKYINISKTVESINSEESKNEEELKDSLSVPNQGKNINVNYTISNMMKKTKFNFDLIFEGTELKKPRVKVSVINQSKPDKVNFNLIEPQEGCGKIIELVEASIEKVNYTLNMDFFTNSTDLYVNTFADFDSYYISKELHEIEEIKMSKCIKVMGNIICTEQYDCNENNPTKISNRTNILIPRKIINEHTIILME